MLLSRATLRQLPSAVTRPGYDPARLQPGIVHLGLGNFHRAHMARYTDALMTQADAALQWGIVGVGMLASDAAVIAALRRQDGLYTLTERDRAGEATRVIGSLAALLLAPEQPAEVLAAIDLARIVSLTVTSHGYCLDAASGLLDPRHPAIVADLANPGRPTSAIGILAEGLCRRRAAGVAAFTALSCDNIQHNGDVLRGAVLRYAELRDPELASWIGEHGRFPNTMVDRITPRTLDSDAQALRERTGIADEAPVFAERFTQWVIEDSFADGRPPWEEVGAELVADVAPFERMKLRLLNASHLAIAAPGQLAGYTMVDETLGDPAFARYMRLLMDRETGPTVGFVPGTDLDAYEDAVAERFGNPAIRDTLQRINTDAPVTYLLDPLRDRLAGGASVDLLALAIAAWVRRARGVSEVGRLIVVEHPLAALLRERAEQGGLDPTPVLAIDSLFGAAGRDDRVIAAVTHWLRRFAEVGVRETIAALG